MNLLIFSGGGDPFGSQYKPVYEIIVKEANLRGFKDVEIVNWPGHFSFPEKDSMSFEKALPFAIKALKKFEDKGEEFIVVARSFGCFVFLEACNYMILEHIKYCVLWGPGAYSTTYWALFKENIELTIQESLAKDVQIDREFFKTTVPIENLLVQLKQHIPLRITTGTADIHCKHYYLKYLEEFIKEKCPHLSVEFYPLVIGAPHEVRTVDSPYINDYYNAIFPLGNRC